MMMLLTTSPSPPRDVYQSIKVNKWLRRGGRKFNGHYRYAFSTFVESARGEIYYILSFRILICGRGHVPGELHGEQRTSCEFNSHA